MLQRGWLGSVLGRSSSRLITSQALPCRPIYALLANNNNNNNNNSSRRPQTINHHHWLAFPSGCRGLCQTANDASCPFATLGISKTVSYEEARAKFLQLALDCHPDQQHRDEKDDDDSFARKRQLALEQFVSLRNALERLEASPTGRAVLKNHGKTSWNSNVEEWFQEKTGYDPRPDKTGLDLEPQVVREMIQASESLSQGGLDRGGMWQLAASLREEAKKKGLPPLRIDQAPQDDDGTPPRRGRRRAR